MNKLVINYLDTFVFEHPETVMRVFMHVLGTWLGAPRSKSPNDLEKYRDFKFCVLRDLIKYMGDAMDREKCRRSQDALGKGLYPRRSFPARKRLPVFHWERAKEIAAVTLAHLQQLAPDDALHFYSELTVAWFFACPEVLLRLSPHFLGNVLEQQPKDMELADALWLWFQLYLVDPAWFS